MIEHAPNESNDAGNPAGQSKTEALAALNKEIQAHLQQDSNQSYLDKVTNFVTSPFHHEDTTLKNAQALYQKALTDPNSVQVTDINKAIAADKSSTGSANTFTSLGSEFVKTGALFLGGKVGLGTTIAAYAFGQANPTDSLGVQLTDMGLGGLKGGLTKGLFAAVGPADVGNFAMKGVILGAGARTIDLGLTRSTWQDANGGLSGDHALNVLAQGAWNRDALISDAAIFGLAGSVSFGVNKVTAGALDRSPFFKTVLTGGTFGATGGAYSEYERQKANGEGFDLSKIAGSAALHGLVDGVAAAPGGIQADAGLRTAISTKIGSAKDTISNFKVPTFEVPTAKFGGSRFSTGTADTVAPREPITIWDSLESAAPQDRLNVWKQEISKGGGNVVAGNRAISLLPEGDRLAAVEHVLQTEPSENAGRMFRQVPTEQLPQLTKTILDSTTGATRAELLRDVSIGNANPETVLKTFQAASDTTGSDLQSVRSWWSQVPEPPAEYTPGKVPTPGRDALVDQLDPKFLGRLMFEGRENGVNVDELTKRNPQFLQELARNVDLQSDAHMQNVAKTVATWQSSKSLAQTANTAIELSAGATNGRGIESLPDVLATIAAKSNPQDIADTTAALRTAAFDSTNESQTWLATTTAARIAKFDPAGVEQNFFQPLQDAIANRNFDYDWRLSTTRLLANLERTGDLPEGSIHLPELRMPARKILTDAQQAESRKEIESALHSGDNPDALFGNMSVLGQLYPDVFGSYDQAGGIEGRPQHEHHAFDLSTHTTKVLDGIRSNPEFKTLSEKDQTDLLLAGLMHDSAKRPGIIDPGHEAVSSDVAWGALQSLGYSPTRIARITNLVSSHSAMSFQPDNPTQARISDTEAIDQLAVKYSHPSALKQLRILNEADIKAVKDNNALWNETVQQHLDDLTDAVAKRRDELTTRSFPVMTSELPQHFGLGDAPPDYRLLGHVTPHMHGPFFDRLPLLESSQFSASTSLLTPEHSQLFKQDSNLVPLFQGSPERVSQAYSGYTAGGEAVGWKGHVDLAKDFANSWQGTEISERLDSSLSKLGFGQPGEPLSALKDFRTQMAQYDSVDDVVRAQGPGSKLAQGANEVTKALTTDLEGQPLQTENEIKLNNPTLVGLGIYRRGQSVVLGGATPQDIGSLYPPGTDIPPWLDPTGRPTENSVVVPKSVWTQMRALDLPMVVMDPKS